MSAPALPPSLAPASEAHRELAKAKQRVAAKPNLRSAGWRTEVQRLALCLHALGRDDEALAVARWLGEADVFQGSYDLWTPLGHARCLAARIARTRGGEVDARALVLPLEVHDVFAALPPEGVRERQRGLADEVRAQAAKRDARVPRLKLYWALSGLMHYRETAGLNLPHAPHVDRATCDAAVDEGLALLRRWLEAKA